MKKIVFSGKKLSPWFSGIMMMISLTITGCTSISAPTTNSQQVLHVSVSELSQYWIVKDGVLDWSVLFQDQEITGDFTANFVINSLGEIQLLDLTQISDSLKTDELKLVNFSRQSFIATKGNYSNQPVSVTARVILN